MTNPVIPDAAVEAAAEWLPHSGDCEVRPERDCTCWHPRVNLMRAALAAAAPYLMPRAVAFLDESVTVISADPDASDYERGFDDATRGMAAKVKRLLSGEAK